MVGNFLCGTICAAELVSSILAFTINIAYYICNIAWHMLLLRFNRMLFTMNRLMDKII